MIEVEETADERQARREAAENKIARELAKGGNGLRERYRKNMDQYLREWGSVMGAESDTGRLIARVAAFTAAKVAETKEEIES